MRLPPDRHPLARHLRHDLRGTDLLPPGARILVAVSGGLDSIVLLHLLRFARIAPGIRLCVAHLDHAMRADSPADAAWVAGICRAWSVPLLHERLARAPRGEADARSARYAFLARCAAGHAADRIATAHHADDQAETVLFRILRGTGLPGLAGIPVRRGTIVRPLLHVPRYRLFAYARDTGLRWREDPSNLDPRHARNRIRHRLLPALEREWPGATTRLARLAEDAAGAEATLAPVLERLRHDAVRSAAGVIVLDRPLLQSYHPWSRARVIRDTLSKAGIPSGRPAVSSILRFLRDAPSGATLDIGGRFRLERAFDEVLLQPHGQTVPDQEAVIAGPSAGQAGARIGGRSFRVEWREHGTEHGDAIATFDAAALAYPLTIRRWRPGDRIRFPYGTKRVKKVWGERRVARSRRERVPLLVDAAGNVLWIIGVARSATGMPRHGHPTVTIAVSDVTGD